MKTKLAILLSLALAIHAYAGSATWNLNASSSDWNDPLNWTPNTVPNGEQDVATFDVSHRTGVRIIEFGEIVDVEHITFTSTASPYTLMVGQHFSAHLNFNGLGIVNNSGVTQNISVRSGIIEFLNESNAGVQTVFTVDSIGAIGGEVSFFDTSSAGSAIIITRDFDGVEFDDQSTAASGTFFSVGSTLFMGNSTAGIATVIIEGGALPFNFGGFLNFREDSTGGSAHFTLKRGRQMASRGVICTFADNSTAGQARITAEGGNFDNDQRAELTFTDTTSAGDAMITLEGAQQSQVNGAILSFNESSSAGNSVLVANSGTVSDSGAIINFNSDSTGGTSRIKVLGPGGGTLNIDNHAISGVSIGSVEGDGAVVLGANTLTLGINNLSTTFSGTISDGEKHSGGSLTKVGSGTLTLTGPNRYTGGTIITSGILLVSNVSASGTGTGAVSVNAGTLGGSGIIAGAVTVGTNTGVQAFLAPSKGAKKPATLAIQGALTLNDDATYLYKLDTKRWVSDQVLAQDVMIDDGAKFSLRASGTPNLPLGQVFTVISNTSASAISGRFHNLADGAIVTVNGNNLQASYEGGDGNDLTLTVVP